MSYLRPLAAFLDPLRPIDRITVKVTTGDPILQAMHRQQEPWTPEQWAYAEAAERDAARFNEFNSSEEIYE